MRIIDVLNALQQQPPAAKYAERPASDQTFFEVIMSGTNTSQLQTDSAPPSRHRDDNRERPAATDERRPENRENVNRRDRQQADTEEPAATPEAPADKIQQDRPATESEEAAPEIDEEQALAYIAAILEVPIETVKEWLAEMDISLADLTDPAEVSKLLQLALDAETPTKLITNPEFPALYKALNEGMTELVQEAVKTHETILNEGTVDPEILAKAADAAAQVATSNENAASAAKANAHNTITNMAESGEIHATYEDGKLVVTEGESATELLNKNTAQSQDETGTESARQVRTETNSTLAAEETESGTSAEEIRPEQAAETQADTAPPETNTPDPMLNMNVTRVRVAEAVRQIASPPPVDSADIIEQIKNQVKVVNSGGQFTEMRMTLRPESLGDVVLRVLTQNGIVVAQFEAESQRVKEALESDFNLLRNALEEQGIRFSELSVSVRGEENDQNLYEHGRQRTRKRMESVKGADTNEEPTQINRNLNGTIDISA